MVIIKEDNARKSRREEAAERHDRQRRGMAEVAVRLSDTEVTGLAEAAAPVLRRPSHMSHEEHEKWLLNGHQDALERFKACVHDRQVDAYLKGRDDATDRQAQRAYFMRSAVLLLVVLAVVSLPIVAIGLHIDPQEFGAYVAPVTGIAGTVVGYWFGTGKQHQCCDR